jgi:hypothetical protein
MRALFTQPYLKHKTMNKTVKNWIFRAVAVTLLAAGLFIYLSQTKNTLNTKINISLFTDPELQKLTIVQQNNSITLKETHEKWWANDSIEASIKKVNDIVDVFKSIVFQHPVTGQKKDDLHMLFSKEGILVKGQLNKKQNTQLLLFTDKSGIHYLANNTIKDIWQIYISENIKSLNSIFSTQLSHWESNHLFSYKPKEIKKIEIKWNQPNEKFSIMQLPNAAYELNINNVSISNMIDKYKIKFYLYEFQNIQLNKKANSYAQMKGTNICSLELIDSQNRVKSVNVYQMINENNTINKQHVIIHLEKSNTWGSISYLKLSPILKHSDFFLQKEN